MRMKNNKVLYISQEIAPYLPETPLSTLGRDIPQNIQEKGFEVRTFMPKYGCINERRNQLHEVIRLSGINVVIDDTDNPLIIKVATLQPSRMQVYFIDNDDYFHHTPDKDLEIRISPENNDERMIFFVRGVIETVKKLRWEPAIIHCTGWISAITPLYIKHLFNEDPIFANSKVVYALHEDKFDGTLDPRFAEKLRMTQVPAEYIDALGSGPIDYIKLNKLAIDYADAIIQASENVDPELMEYAKASGKPFLPMPDKDSTLDEYANFYANLIEEA